MLHLSRQLVSQTFLQLGYSCLDYLYLDQIQKSLNQLNQQAFDKQTLEELENQCSTNSRGQIKLDDLIGTFLKAQSILVQRDQQIKRLINKLQNQVNQKYISNQSNPQQLQNVQEELYEAKQQQVSNNINLQIIRKPFLGKKTLSSQRSPRQTQNLYHFTAHRQQQQASEYASVSLPGQGMLSIANTHTFSWIFQLCVLLLVILVPCMFYTPCFMSSIILLFVVLNMISGYFCRFIIRIWMGVVGMSIVVDVIWYIMGIKPYWQQTSDYSANVHSYLRLCVVLYGVVGIGKIVLFILLASEYNTDESEKKIVSVFGFLQIQLSHDQPKKNIFSTLNKGTSHHEPIEDSFN